MVAPRADNSELGSDLWSPKDNWCECKRRSSESGDGSSRVGTKWLTLVLNAVEVDWTRLPTGHCQGAFVVLLLSRPQANLVPPHGSHSQVCLPLACDTLGAGSTHEVQRMEVTCPRPHGRRGRARIQRQISGSPCCAGRGQLPPPQPCSPVCFAGDLVSSASALEGGRNMVKPLGRP